MVMSLYAGTALIPTLCHCSNRLGPQSLKVEPHTPPPARCSQSVRGEGCRRLSLRGRRCSIPHPAAQSSFSLPLLLLLLLLQPMTVTTMSVGDLQRADSTELPLTQRKCCYLLWLPNKTAMGAVE